MQITYTKSMKRAFILSLIMTASLQVSPAKAAAGQVKITEGSDSYETAAKVATTNWTTSKDIVLVCGEGYADAVSASVLAKQLNAPILLTTTKSLNSNTKAALDTLKPENIYIIGGNASISQSVRTELRNANYNLVELGGKDRYETNVAVANQLVALGVNAENVMLVSGEGFADVLSATPIAAAKGQILLLGNNNSNSMKSILDFVKTNNSKVTVVGTNNSINDSIYKALGATKRVDGGSNRFETNLNVLTEFSDDLKTDKLFIANASGERYADALIASSLAGKWTAPLVLLDDENSSSTGEALDYIKNKASNATELSIISELGVVSDSVVSKVNSTVSSPTPEVYSPTVKSVTTNGLNQIKVVFNTPVDESSAEQIQNYTIDGNVLSEASSTLQEDSKTVFITFKNPFQQYKTTDFVVKNSIMNLSLKNTISKYEQKITFSDVSTPVLQAVTPLGGNKLILQFSKPIRMTISDLSKMKINRQSISNYGLNTTQTIFGNQSDVWSDKVELYFNSPLPIGNNTFTMPNGDLGIRFDNAAGFPIVGSSVNFTVNSASGTPTVSSVTSDNSKSIFITFDRSMDRQTALEDSNYTLNSNIVSVSSSEDISFVQGSKDTVVKIKNLNYSLKDGSNHIQLSNNIKDSYGNSIKSISFDFIYGNDVVKPQISNINVRDGQTLRINFNKDVQDYYAKNKLNYRILDSTGADISYKITSINRISNSSGGNSDVYDITFNDSTALKGSKYTLTISNIVDAGTTPNVMDVYTTTFSGLDKELPDVTSIVKSLNDDQEVVIFFNKSMDESTIIDPANYSFKDGNGDTQKLPRSVTLTPGVDDKCVILHFPTSYRIKSGSDERYVIKLKVANVKDKDGKILQSMSYNGEISTDSYNGPKLIDNTARLFYVGNDIKVKFSLSDPLDIANASDFKVAGQSPDSVAIDGNNVILTFIAGINDNKKIDQIRSSGTSTTLSISNNSSVDAAGRKIRTSSDIILLPPITRPDSWTAHSSGGYNTVSIVFDQYIDDDVKSSYNDDFIFANEKTGEKLKVSYVTVSNKTVIFNFENGAFKIGDGISIKANSDNSVINIRDVANNNGDYEVYSPTLDDIGGRTIVVH